MKQMNMYDILDRLNRIGADSPTVKAAIEQVSNFNQVTEADCDSREPVEEKYMGFSKLEKDIAKRGDVKDPAAVAASIGRKKYGKAKFQKAAAAGKKLGEVKKSTVRPLKENIESVMRAMPREFDAFTRTGELSDKLYDVLFDIYRDDMPYGVAKARTGDPYEWITNRLHQDIENWSGRSLDEADMEEGNAFAYAVQKAKADGIQKGETITVGGQDYPLREGKAKPDYLDFDRDGNKKEPMKKALRDKKQGKVDEEGPGLFRQVYDRLGKMVRGDKKDPNQSDAETQRLARQAKPVNELDINLIKAAQKKAKDEPMFQKDPESERNIGKKYGYRSDADDDSDDDYDEWGERKKKKVHAPAPGEKRGRGRPRKYTADAPRKERVTAKSRKTDRTAWSKDEYDEEGEMAKTQSRTIADAALELQAMLGDNENLPEWVQKKISLAKDYIDRARDYMKANRPDEELVAEKAVSKAQRAAAGIARAAQKGEIPKSELRGASKEMAKMPAGELRKFAKTKEKGLPQKKTNETTVAGSVAPAMAKEEVVTHGRHKGKQWSPDTPGPTNPDYKEIDRGVPSPPDGATAPPKGYKPPKPAAKAGQKPAAKPAAKPTTKPAAKKADAGSETAVAETDADPTDNGAKASKGGMQFGKGIYDSFNRELEGMIAESLSVNTSISTEGGKSVSINATEEDADRLLDMLKMAGIGSSMDRDACPTCGKMPCGCDQIDEVTENEPDYPVNMGAEQDEVYMLQKLAGGLNGPKRQVNPNNAGDNPLAMKALGKRGSGQVNVDESTRVEQSLWNLYKKV
jgi:hypothetical protein